MTPKRAVAMLIVVSALVRLVSAACLGLGNDEAYHFLYAVHPDLSYYDHPPMLAWVETIGLTFSGSPFSAAGAPVGFHPPLRRLDLAHVADRRPVVWPVGGILRGARRST